MERKDGIIKLKKRAKGNIVVKESMAITMIDPYNVTNTPFAQGYLVGIEKSCGEGK